MDIKKYGKGALKQPKDLRDYRLEVVAGAEPLPVEFSIRDRIGLIKNQDGSGSCVSQAFSYYTEVLNQIETGQKVQLSARDIYSLVYQPQSGSYLRDNAKKIINSGVIPESKAPSYMNGVPPTEEFMRDRSDITSEAQEEGMVYLAKTFVTWDNANFDSFKRAIYQGNGAVIAAWGNDMCWTTNSGIIQVPDNASQCNWGHGIYCTGWKVINGVEHLEFINSWSAIWGDKGFGYMPKGYIEKGFVFNPVTLVDLPNQTYSLIQQTISVLKNLISLMQELIAKLRK
jgi:C1A family cysteine protease